MTLPQLVYDDSEFLAKTVKTTLLLSDYRNDEHLREAVVPSKQNNRKTAIPPK
jgi:hypothetical protein